MITTPEQAIAAIRLNLPRLDRQAKDAEHWRDYYEGKQPLRFSSAQWREWFGGQFADFSDNWCAPVADATAERQRIIGVKPFEGKGPDPDLARVMAVNGLDTQFSQAAIEAQYARRAFTLVWTNSNDPSTPTVTFESATQVLLRYAPGTRREPVLALKRWQDEDTGRINVTLYTPQHLWKFHAGGSVSGLILPASLASDWQPRYDDGDTWPLPNPLGRVPVSELPNKTTLSGEPLSAIAGVAAMQDAVNLLWAHLFTASDFAALPQRIVLGAELPKIPILDKDGQKIGEKVIDLPEANIRRILNLEGPNADVKQWDAADLSQFLEVIKRAVGHIADQTRTPAYYFSSGTGFSNISGDTVKALDAGLVQKTNGVNTSMSDGARRTGELVCIAQGDRARAAAMAAGSAVWAGVEIRSEAQLADAMLKFRQMGFPFEWVAKQKIDDPDELREVMDAYEAERRDGSMDDLARQLRQRQNDNAALGA